MKLSDVFGIRLGSYEEVENMNEISRISYTGKKVRVNYKGKNVETESPRYDMIEPKGAKVLANITSLDQDYPVITSHKYGKGKAIYIGLPARNEVLSPLVDDLISELSIKQGPDVPENVMARQIDKNHILYLNISSEPQKIALKGKAKGILFDENYNGGFTIAPFEPEFIEIM